MPSKIDPDLAHAIEREPDAVFEAVVIAVDDLDAVISGLPPSARVLQRFRLIGGVAVEAAARDLLDIAEMPTVKSVEPVRDVHAC